MNGEAFKGILNTKNRDRMTRVSETGVQNRK